MAEHTQTLYQPHVSDNHTSKSGVIISCYQIMSTHFIHHLLKTDVLLVSKGKKDSIKCLVQNNEEGIIMRSKKKFMKTWERI